MGLLDQGSIGNYHNAMTGQTGENAALMAAYFQVQGIDKASEYITERGDELAAQFDPRIQTGEAAFQEYAAGRTPEGFASNLEAIRQGGAYEQLLQPRMEQAQRQLAATGLSRSSFGARRAADVSQDTLLALEGMLSGRQRDVSGLGYQALGAQTQMNVGQMNALSELMLQRSAVQAGGVLGQAQAEVQGAANQYTAIHNVGSSIMGMFGGGGGGGGGGFSGGGTQTGINTQPTLYGNQSGSFYTPSGAPSFYDNQSPFGGSQYGGYA